jgi:hypothetical protein
MRYENQRLHGAGWRLHHGNWWRRRQPNRANCYIDEPAHEQARRAPQYPEPYPQPSRARARRSHAIARITLPRGAPYAEPQLPASRFPLLSLPQWEVAAKGPLPAAEDRRALPGR